eukprot:gene27935-34721_t
METIPDLQRIDQDTKFWKAPSVTTVAGREIQQPEHRGGDYYTEGSTIMSITLHYHSRLIVHFLKDFHGIPGNTPVVAPVTHSASVSPPIPAVITRRAISTVAPCSLANLSSIVSIDDVSLLDSNIETGVEEEARLTDTPVFTSPAPVKTEQLKEGTTDKKRKLWPSFVVKTRTSTGCAAAANPIDFYATEVIGIGANTDGAQCDDTEVEILERGPKDVTDREVVDFTLEVEEGKEL